MGSHRAIEWLWVVALSVIFVVVVPNSPGRTEAEIAYSVDTATAWGISLGILCLVVYGLEFVTRQRDLGIIGWGGIYARVGAVFASAALSGRGAESRSEIIQRPKGCFISDNSLVVGYFVVVVLAYCVCMHSTGIQEEGTRRKWLGVVV